MAGSGKSIGDTVREARKAAGMTQEKLAQRSGVSLATIRSIETGRVQKPYRLRDVYRALGLQDPDTFAAGDLSDDELIRELERRRPGLLDALVEGRPLPPAPGQGTQDVTRKGDVDGSASQPA